MIKHRTVLLGNCFYKNTHVFFRAAGVVSVRRFVRSASSTASQRPPPCSGGYKMIFLTRLHSMLAHRSLARMLFIIWLAVVAIASADITARACNDSQEDTRGVFSYQDSTCGYDADCGVPLPVCELDTCRTNPCFYGVPSYCQNDSYCRLYPICQNLYCA